ncbi:hypothetical protein U0070_005308, partial [Myodes glareolus]
AHSRLPGPVDSTTTDRRTTRPLLPAPRRAHDHPVPFGCARPPQEAILSPLFGIASAAVCENGGSQTQPKINTKRQRDVPFRTADVRKCRNCGPGNQAFPYAPLAYVSVPGV